MNDRLASALDFAAIGVRVVIARGKDPGGYVGKDWQAKATTDERTLRGWWSSWPRGNVGVVGDRVMVPLDVDNRASFDQLQAETVAAPPTPRYITGGAPGRMRLLFSHPGDNEIGTKLADGVQLRRGPLMSIVPPSLNPDSGEYYEWTTGLDEAPLAPLPESWIARVTRAASNGTRAPDEWVKMFRRHYHAGEGECHPSTMAIAAYLVRKLGSGQVALELLLAWNEVHCHPPKPENEIVEQVRWAVKKEAASRRAATRKEARR